MMKLLQRGIEMISDPVADAERHYTELDAANDAQIKCEQLLAQDFLSACRKCDANALATWAPKVRVVGCMECQDLHEVMADAMDYNAPDAPRMSEAMQLLLNVAYGKDPAEKHKVHARALIERMAEHFARFNSWLYGAGL